MENVVFILFELAYEVQKWQGFKLQDPQIPAARVFKPYYTMAE